MYRRFCRGQRIQVTVDSLVGAAEMQKTGQYQWKPIALAQS